MANPTMTKQGADQILFDRDRFEDIPREWFDESYWRGSDKVEGDAPGRGHALFVRQGEQAWVLRHYHRGGVIALVTEDRYLWLGAEHSRAFREWRLLSELSDRGLPVPRPIAACVHRGALTYKADIITAYLEHTHSLAAMINAGDTLTEHWRRIGQTLRRFHDQGVDHADLNARNILLDERQRVFLVDFDRGGLRSPGAWRRGNLQRLQRSLRKIALETGAEFDDVGWRSLEEGYHYAL